MRYDPFEALAAALQGTEAHDPAESIGLKVFTLVDGKEHHAGLALVPIWRWAEADLVHGNASRYEALAILELRPGRRVLVVELKVAALLSLILLDVWAVAGSRLACVRDQVHTCTSGVELNAHGLRRLAEPEVAHIL